MSTDSQFLRWSASIREWYSQHSRMVQPRVLALQTKQAHTSTAIYIRAKTHTSADKPSCRAAISALRSIFSCCRKNSDASSFLVSSALSCDHQPDSAITRIHTCVSFFTCSGSVSSLSSSFYERQSTHPHVCVVLIPSGTPCEPLCSCAARPHAAAPPSLTVAVRAAAMTPYTYVHSQHACSQSPCAVH